MKDDMISRQAAIDALHMHLMYRMGTDSNKKRLDDWINGLPSAQETHEERTETHACDFNQQTGGEKLIQVYRQLDVTEPDHAGNREYKPGFFETDEEAQALADSLNTKHWKISYSMLYRNGSVQEAEATIAADTIDQALKMAQLNITKPMLQTGAYEDIVIWDVAIMEDDVF